VGNVRGWTLKQLSEKFAKDDMVFASCFNTNGAGWHVVLAGTAADAHGIHFKRRYICVRITTTIHGALIVAGCSGVKIDGRSSTEILMWCSCSVRLSFSESQWVMFRCALSKYPTIQVALYEDVITVEPFNKGALVFSTWYPSSFLRYAGCIRLWLSFG